MVNANQLASIGHHHLMPQCWIVASYAMLIANMRPLQVVYSLFEHPLPQPQPPMHIQHHQLPQELLLHFLEP